MLKFIFGGLTALGLILVVGIVGGLTWLGLTPMSAWFGTGQVDLGIKVTAAESQAAVSKVGTQIVALPAGTANDQGWKLSGTKPASFTMTCQELSAHSNNRAWKNYPVKNVQIKIQEDGTIESSAVLIVSKALPYAMGLGYSEAQIKAAMEKYNLPALEIPIYILGQGSVTNDQVSVNATKVKIGGVVVPEDIVGQANAGAEAVLNDLIAKNTQSFHSETLTFANGQMNFKGRVAEKLSVVTN